MLTPLDPVVAWKNAGEFHQDLDLIPIGRGVGCLAVNPDPRDNEPDSQRTKQLLHNSLIYGSSLAIRAIERDPANARPRIEADRV